MASPNFEVQEKQLDALLIAGIRMRARYSECGKAFAAICRHFGRRLCGKPMLLHFDSDYRETDADFEACIPVRGAASAEGITVRELPGGRCAALLHQGPYDEPGRSYQKILDYVKQKGYRIESPSREVYLKGPGMIFRGNPKKYLTEIQMLIKPE